MSEKTKPLALKEEHLLFLDRLREKGTTNMFGAAPFLKRRFRINNTDAREILFYWMDTFSERHPA